VRIRLRMGTDAAPIGPREASEPSAAVRGWRVYGNDGLVRNKAFYCWKFSTPS